LYLVTVGGNSVGVHASLINAVRVLAARLASLSRGGRFKARRAALSVIGLACVALVLAACATQPVPAAPAPAATLHLTSPPWPPFADVEGKERVAIALVHGALERAGYSADTRVLPSAPWAESLRSGTSNGSATTWRSQEREAYLLYSKPYLENRLVLVGRAGTDVSAKSFAELSGKRVGLQEGFAYGEAVDAAKEPIFVRYPGLNQTLQALAKNELDYVLIDELVVTYLFDDDAAKAKEHFAIGEQTLVKRTLHFTLRKDLPGAQAIIDRFDAEIPKMMRDGTYNRLLQVTWVVVDVDSDGLNELVLAGTAAGKTAPATGYQPLTTAASPGPAAHPPHYFINGKLYNTWDAVPEEYKADPSPDLRRPKTVNFDVIRF
jgi:polar amino acid transport system substrate-binding protein